MNTCFNDLWDLGYKIQKPHNLTQEHVRQLCVHWHEKGIAVSTLSSRLSNLRMLWRWMKKGGEVHALPHYLPHVDKESLKVRRVAQQSKSWTENGVDIEQKLLEAGAIDKRFEMMLRVSLAFGLRLSEVLKLQPYRAHMGHRLRLTKTKNGRARDVDIETEEQVEALKLMLKFTLRADGYLGWPETVRGKPATTRQNQKHFHNLMARLGITRKDAGVTMHGLRAQYAEDTAIRHGMIPPTLGGTGGQLTKHEIEVKRGHVSELLGHSRISITNAYYGSFDRHAKPDPKDLARDRIHEAISYCSMFAIKPVPEERMEDCKVLVTELAAIDVDITLRQVQLLWEINSGRFARPWKSLDASNLKAIEAAAIRLVAQESKKTSKSINKDAGLAP